MNVGPNSHKIVCYKMTGRSASVSFKIGATFKKGATQIKEETKSKGNKVIRTNRGQDVGIAVYYCRTANAILLTYENNSSEYRLIEKVGFELDGCRIEGFRGHKLKITLEPGETDVLRIVPFYQGGNWNVKMTSCRYSVVRTRWNWSWN